MSPTMTEGGIAGWKKKNGESFVAGDVLLEIVRPQKLQNGRSGFTRHDLQETDKATIDVEAQDDGVMGMILVRFFLNYVLCELSTSIGPGWLKKHRRRKNHRSTSRGRGRHL